MDRHVRAVCRMQVTHTLVPVVTLQCKNDRIRIAYYLFYSLLLFSNNHKIQMQHFIEIVLFFFGSGCRLLMREPTHTFFGRSLSFTCFLLNRFKTIFLLFN